MRPAGGRSDGRTGIGKKEKKILTMRKQSRETERKEKEKSKQRTVASPTCTTLSPTTHQADPFS
jgi:hypothetical protein